MSEVEGRDRALDAETVRAAVRALPGWSLIRARRGLRRGWQFESKEDAAAFIFMAITVSFLHGIFPDLTWFGRSVVCVLVDPQAEAVTLRLIELAKRLTLAAGPIVADRAQPNTAWVQRLVHETAHEVSQTPAALAPHSEDGQ